MAVKNKEVDQDKLAYVEMALETPDTEKGMAWYKSLPSAAGKGLLKGIVELGRAAGPLAPYSYEDPEEKKQSEEELWNRILPTEEGGLESSLERGGRLFPSLASGGGGIPGLLLRSLMGGASGQLAEELGGGPIVQALAEIVGSTGPDLAKKIPLTKSQKPLESFFKKMNVSEETKALSLGQESPLRDIAKSLAPGGRKTKTALSSAAEELSDIFKRIRNKNISKQKISPDLLTKFETTFNEVATELPAELREKVSKDFIDFLKSNQTPSDAMNLWQDLNYFITKGESKAGILKGPISELFESISPDLAQDFKDLNKMYGNFASLAQEIAPDIVDNLLKKGEMGLFLGAVLTRNKSLLEKLAGIAGGRLAAGQIIRNPRLQNLGKRFIRGIGRQTPAAVKKSFEAWKEELKKTDKEAGLIVEDFDVDELISNFPSKNTKS